MSEQSAGITQDTFLHTTVLNMAAIAEASLDYRPGESQAGFLAEIARAKHYAEFGEHMPIEISFVSTERMLEKIVKRVDEGKVLPPRWRLLDETERTVGGVVNSHGPSVMMLVRQLRMQRRGATEDYTAIDPEKAVFTAEGGANKTSPVRRGVAERAMRAVFGDDLREQMLYQFGSNRLITPHLLDRKTNEPILDNETNLPKPNQEFTTIRALAPTLPADEPFTEFQANVATALADGYYLDGLPDYAIGQDTVFPTIILDHDDSSRPSLCLVQPEGRGLPGALEALVDIKSLIGRQIVVASNGQYRAKNEVVLRQFADKHPELGLMPGAAIGDEPGDVASYALGDIVTPTRPLSAYVNELPIYFRAAKELMLAHHAIHLNTQSNSVPFEARRPNGSVVRLKPNGIELILAAA